MHTYICLVTESHRDLMIANRLRKRQNLCTLYIYIFINISYLGNDAGDFLLVKNVRFFNLYTLLKSLEFIQSCIHTYVAYSISQAVDMNHTNRIRGECK